MYGRRGFGVAANFGLETAVLGRCDSTVGCVSIVGWDRRFWQRNGINTVSMGDHGNDAF